MSSDMKWTPLSQGRRRSSLFSRILFLLISRLAVTEWLASAVERGITWLASPETTPSVNKITVSIDIAEVLRINDKDYSIT
ncbi:Gammaaminobutyric acid receptor subunit deltalike, partial [Caligus rogercresseyi]